MTVLQLHILSCVRQPDTVVLVATVRQGVQLYPVTSAKDLRHETGATQQLPVTRPHERDRMCNRITAHARSSDYNLVRALPRHPRCDEHKTTGKTLTVQAKNGTRHNHMMLNTETERRTTEGEQTAANRT